MPFGDFVADKTIATKEKIPTQVSAHSRYYPGEWSSARCKGALLKLHKEFKEHDAKRQGNDLDPDEASSRKKKLREAFDLICKHNSPVFRYFFVEHFVQPEAWYAARMRYTRSVAVSSIVGHMLGIGKSLPCSLWSQTMGVLSQTVNFLFCLIFLAF